MTADAAHIDQQARDWFLRRDEAGAAEAAAAWRAADPRHQEAYRRVELAWTALGRTETVRDGDWRAEAAMLSRKSRFVIPSAIAAGLVAAVALGVVLLRPPAPDARVETRVAQLQTLDLADGSRVFVGARSAVDVRMKPDARHVVLKSGEAFFEVAHDPARPFTVETDDAVIRVLGTRFDVRRGADGTQVSVLDGRVEVRRKALIPPSDPDRVLVRGEQVSVVRGETPGPVAPAAVEAGSWRQGRLLYANASLAEIVADANRYADRPIRLADDRVGAMRATVSFRADAVGDLVANLEAALPLKAVRQSDGSILLSQTP